MPADPRLALAFQPFVRRAALVEFWKYAATGLIVALVIGQSCWLAGVRSPFVPIALAAGALTIGAVAALRRRPALIGVARRVDERANLQDLIVSALDAGGDGLAVLVRNDAVTALARQDPRKIYSLELPAGWRRIAVAALVAETALLGFAWQAPRERASNSSLASLVLPNSGGASASQAAHPNPSKPDESRPTSDVTPQPSSAASMKTGGGVPAVERGETNGAAAAPAGADRIGLARTDAESDITAGRVPAAKRAMVERYFAALQAQRKTPR